MGYIIKINGNSFDQNQLINVCKDYIALNRKDYYSEVYSFILKWFDDKDYIYLKTSGTTGSPKTISLKKIHLINSAIATSRYFGLDSSMNLLLCLPVTFIAGIMMIVRAFVNKCNLIIEEPKSNPFIDVNETIHFTAITPFQLFHSIDTIRSKEIRNIIVGGSEISAYLEGKVSELKTNVYATYGMTETCSHVAIRSVNNPSNSDVYLAMDNITFSTDDQKCLIIHAPLISDNPIYTNDCVELIDKKRFRWLGRRDNIINSGGLKISPEWIEKKISTVLKYDYFISSIPDDALGEKVVLVVENSTIINKDEEFLNLKNILSKYEMPKDIVYVDKIIRSENGKILRKETMKKYR